jgi:riboflavin kinase/FMN adenylyltransferase
MKTLHSLSLLKQERRPVVLAIGFFDGVHSGHRKVIAATRARAKALRGRAWVLTFDPHPLQVLKPAGAPPLLTSTRHKLDLLSRLGIDGVVVMPFTRRLARVRPGGFVELLKRCVPPLVEILVGTNWRFGRSGRGTPALLARLCRRAGIQVRVIRPVRKLGGPVSSTRIRREIVRGNLRGTETLLGRPFSVLGTVIHGHGIGRRIGFPTANLDPCGEALTPYGVYAVQARLGNRLRNGVLSIGVRPTFRRGGEAKPSFELHLPGVRRNLYGTDIEVVFRAKLRNERRFASVEGLNKQIARDIANAARKISLPRVVKPQSANKGHTPPAAPPPAAR